MTLPSFSLVCLIGTSGSGKSTFASRHFLPTEVLSSDTFRGYVSNDEESLEATTDAFDALHHLLRIRLRRGLLTVVDATNVQPEARAPLLRIANEFHALKVAIVLDVPEETCLERNRARPNRQFGSHVVRNQRRDLKRTLGQLKKERWHRIYVLSPEQIDAAEFVREPLFSHRQEETGPFDIIGDIHGCAAELRELLTNLGYELEPMLRHPDGRRVIFLGDLVDRGPDSVAVLRSVMSWVREGAALCVPGNHDVKLARALAGRQVSKGHGLAETLEALAAEPEEFQTEVREFLEGLTSHFLLDGGRLCVAHAGLREEMQGRGSGAVRDFALYGETTGEIDEFGLPVRYQWAKEYRGKPLVAYGHTPTPKAEFYNNTICLDTGCCFGGSLSALRYPEREILSVPARAVYAEPARPIDFEATPDAESDALEIQHVLGRRSVATELGGRVTIREENAIAALEVMSRFAADPRWLIYLPPTMSPSETSDIEGYLEYPTEAFTYYRNRGVEEVVCEEKHMGSRAVAVVCRHPEVAARRFRIDTGEQGILTTRTGRRFFENTATESALLARLAQAAEKAGLWDDLNSDWILLDLELMPWSAKALGLLREQYGPVGAAAEATSTAWRSAVESLRARGIEGAEPLIQRGQEQFDAAARFRAAYRRYCWSVQNLEDLKLAPFHLLASEGRMHTDQDHVWHMETLGRLCDQDPAILRRTPYRLVAVHDATAVAGACAWWEDLVSKGGEGMVVKPRNFLSYHEGKLIQPAIKVRGPEYLRIIYGPEYLRQENLSRLRNRNLSRKRGLAMREFSLGLESIRRFVQRQPLSLVHECVFAVLALESEPVDPRL